MHYDDLMAKQRSVSKKKETVFIQMTKQQSSKLTFKNQRDADGDRKLQHPTPKRIATHKLDKTSPFRPSQILSKNQVSNPSLIMNATTSSMFK